MLHLLLVAAIALGAAWLILLVTMALLRPDGATLADAARLLPDVIGLVRRLARDPSLPRRERITLWLLLGYLLSPVDLIPDFVPVLGYADDAIVAVLALRRVVRASSRQTIEHHWQGGATGLAVVIRLAGR